jgi:hypothetical protein
MREKVSLCCRPRADPVVGRARRGETDSRIARQTRWKFPVATGVDEVSSVSYLPTAFTTLFFLAAGLLLGVIR